MYFEIFVVAPLMPATSGLTVIGFLCILYGKYIYIGFELDRVAS